MSGGGRMLEDFLARLRRSVYRDEPLVRSSDEAPAGKVPKLIRAMRSLAQVSGSCWQPREEIFLKQARLMERYEDDFVFEGEVTRYYPTYESLSDAELRGYFAWRTQVRKGRIVPAPLTFAMLYAYEILHLIGCRDAADGYGKLMELGLEFGMTEPALYTYLPAWTYGYVIYYGLDPEYLSDSSYYRDMKLQDEAIAAVLSRGEHPAEEIAAGLCALSSYRLERSKFYRTYTSDMSAVIMRVIARVAEYYEKHRKRNFSSEYIGHECRRLTRIFPGAVFHARSPEEERVYTVNPVRSYECAGGAWYMLAYERELKQARRLGALLRLIDYRMRECTSFPSIKPPKKTTKWLAKIVDEEIEAFFAEKKAAEARRVHIDLSQLGRIRADAAVTRERLIVAEEEEEAAAPISMPGTGESVSEMLPSARQESFSGDADVQTSETDALLDAPELHLLRDLLTGAPLSWVRAEGHIVSVLVDGINEKLYDDFADAVIEGDPPAVIEDYRKELIERYLHVAE